MRRNGVTRDAVASRFCAAFFAGDVRATGAFFATALRVAGTRAAGFFAATFFAAFFTATLPAGCFRDAAFLTTAFFATAFFATAFLATFFAAAFFTAPFLTAVAFDAGFVARLVAAVLPVARFFTATPLPAETARRGEAFFAAARVGVALRALPDARPAAVFVVAALRAEAFFTAVFFDAVFFADADLRVAVGLMRTTPYCGQTGGTPDAAYVAGFSFTDR